MLYGPIQVHSHHPSYSNPSQYLHASLDSMSNPPITDESPRHSAHGSSLAVQTWLTSATNETKPKHDTLTSVESFSAGAASEIEPPAMAPLTAASLSALEEQQTAGPKRDGLDMARSVSPWRAAEASPWAELQRPTWDWEALDASRSDHPSHTSDSPDEDDALSVADSDNTAVGGPYTSEKGLHFPLPPDIVGPGTENIPIFASHHYRIGDPYVHEYNEELASMGYPTPSQGAVIQLPKGSMRVTLNDEDWREGTYGSVHAIVRAGGSIHLEADLKRSAFSVFFRDPRGLCG